MSIGEAEYHVLTKVGDASAEVAQVVARFGGEVRAGLHRVFYVSRANQTVVMASAPDAPISTALRDARGWREPTDGN